MGGMSIIVTFYNNSVTVITDTTCITIPVFVSGTTGITMTEQCYSHTGYNYYYKNNVKVIPDIVLIKMFSRWFFANKNLLSLLHFNCVTLRTM